jgi:hypothetical protein
MRVDENGARFEWRVSQNVRGGLIMIRSRVTVALWSRIAILFTEIVVHRNASNARILLSTDFGRTGI